MLLVFGWDWDLSQGLFFSWLKLQFSLVLIYLKYFLVVLVVFFWLNLLEYQVFVIF